MWGIGNSALPLGPQQTLTLRLYDRNYVATQSSIPTFIPAGTQIYAQVDSANVDTTYGGVLESHEQRGAAYNNISALTLAQAVSTEKWPHALAGAAPEPSITIKRSGPEE